MAFTGDLEHLPIVDVIQLLHSTRKSGTLCVNAGQCESQLVFKDGYIVSANHPSNHLKIGKILVEMEAIGPQVLETALQEQAQSAQAKPLMGHLIETGQIDQDIAFKGLRTLIEMTMVEMLRWTTGSFTLNVDNVEASDEYRYFPEILNKELILDTQMVLLDALRIFDEKNRDGDFTKDASVEPAPPQQQAVEEPKGEPSITADLLGLEALDNLKSKIPDVFCPLETFDPADIHRQKLRRTIGELPDSEQESLVGYLLKGLQKDEGGTPGHTDDHNPAAIVFFSRDELLTHCIQTVSKADGILVFITDRTEDLEPTVRQTIAKGILPVLVFDCPEKPEGGLSRETVLATRFKCKEQFPQLPAIQLLPQGDFSFLPQAMSIPGASLPCPSRQPQNESFARDLIDFLESFRLLVTRCLQERGTLQLQTLKRYSESLQDCFEAPQLSLALLDCLAEIFDRVLTFIVTKTDLIAEKGIGINGSQNRQPSAALKFKIPLAGPSIFRMVKNEGSCFFGQPDNDSLLGTLFNQIGTPQRTDMMLLPIKSRGKVVLVVYGDFGSKDPKPVNPHLLEILASQAGLLLDNSLYRKQLEKISQQG